MTIQYYPKKKEFSIKFGTYELTTERVFEFDNNKNIFDYYQIAVTYKLSLGQGLFIVRNIEGKTIYSQGIFNSKK